MNKWLFLILLLFSSPLIQGQVVVYTSPFTQLFPSAHIEEVDRTILVSEKKIELITVTPEGKDIQSFLVTSITRKKFDHLGESMVLDCTSDDGVYQTLFIIPLADPVELIEIIQPEQYNNEERHFRLLIN